MWTERAYRSEVKVAEVDAEIEVANARPYDWDEPEYFWYGLKPKMIAQLHQYLEDKTQMAEHKKKWQE